MVVSCVATEELFDSNQMRHLSLFENEASLIAVTSFVLLYLMIRLKPWQIFVESGKGTLSFTLTGSFMPLLRGDMASLYMGQTVSVDLKAAYNITLTQYYEATTLSSEAVCLSMQTMHWWLVWGVTLQFGEKWELCKCLNVLAENRSGLSVHSDSSCIFITSFLVFSTPLDVI